MRQGSSILHNHSDASFTEEFDASLFKGVLYITQGPVVRGRLLSFEIGKGRSADVRSFA